MAAPDSIRPTHAQSGMDLDLADFLDRRLSQVDAICACVSTGANSHDIPPGSLFLALWGARDLLKEVQEAMHGSPIGRHLVKSMAAPVAPETPEGGE